MAITSQSFKPSGDDGLPVDASVGPTKTHDYWQTGESVADKPGPTSSGGVATLAGQLVSGSVLDHDHGFAFNVNDPRTDSIAKQDHSSPNETVSTVDPTI